MESATVINIHQTLHGYSNGHNLLAASCELSPEEKRTLLLMSDLSGPSQRSLFETYLTGYPLPGNRFYVLARTWYAEEMRRPGCVWTHSLLIDTASLSRIVWLNVLDSLFQRPSVNRYETYTKFIKIPIGRPGNEIFINEQIKQATNKRYLAYLYQYLYEYPNKVCLIPVNNEVAIDLLILIVWSQQWPRLRRSFSFCTGALSIRRLGNTLLDCQVVPNALDRYTHNNKDLFAILDFNKKTAPSSWAIFLAENYSINFIGFINQYGADVLGHRSRFNPLFVTFRLLSTNMLKELTFVNVFVFLNSAFHGNQEAKGLKKLIIDKKLSIDPKSVVDYIVYLLTNFDENLMLNLNVSFVDLLRFGIDTKSINQENIYIILKNVNVLNVEVQVDILKYLPFSYWIDLKWDNKNIITKIFNKIFDKIQLELVWHQNDKIQNKWYYILYNYYSGDWKPVAYSLLNNNNDRIIDLTEKVGYNIVFWALDWANDNNREMTENCERFIVYNDRLFFYWFSKQRQISVYFLKIFSNIVSLKNVYSKLFGNEIWLRIAQMLISFKNETDFTNCAAYIFTLSLHKNIHNPERIASLLFQPLHDKVKSSILDYHAWSLVQSLELNRPLWLEEKGLWDMLVWPKSYSIPSWDKCEHLRQILADYWILYKWNEYTFLDTITDIDTFDKVAYYCITFKKGRKFINKLYKMLQLMDDPYKVQQANALFQLINKFP